MKIIRPLRMLMPMLFLLCTSLYSQTAAEEALIQKCSEIIEAGGNSRVIEGLEGWYFLQAEIEHLSRGSRGIFWGEQAQDVSKASNPDHADPLPAILDFNDQLKQRNIDLILVPVPAKAAVYPDKLDSSLGAPGRTRVDFYQQRFIQKLRDSGVQVLDIMPLMLDLRSRGTQVYCKTDAHWTPAAIENTAVGIAEILARKSWYNAVPKESIQATKKRISFTGDLVPETGQSAMEEVPAAIITDDEGQYISPDQDSPVLLMGDSHTLVFHLGGDMLAKGTGLADQLAYRLQFPVDLIGVKGSGSTAARINLFRKSKRNPDYLDGKRAVIWCFSVREYTESTGGWRTVPVGP